MDERTRRLLLAAEAKTIGRGGISLVARVTGADRDSISAGVAELEEGLSGNPSTKGVRRPGGGRKKIVDKQPGIKDQLERLVEPLTRGDPESPLRWTCKSTRRLAEELEENGYQVSHQKVAELLQELGYSLQANQKTMEGESQPDRNEQFEHINATAAEYLAAGDPVISVDTKKKELIGPFRNEGWVSVGTDNDTASFAVASIRRWWYSMDQSNYAHAKRLLVTADGGGSNGSRVRLWKLELQNLADELAIPITVCHFPPGTSKWNKIEHRLFSFISQNWRGKPLISHEAQISV